MSLHICPGVRFILDCFLGGGGGWGGGETTHLTFLLFVNLVTLFSVPPFSLFGFLVGK